MIACMHCGGDISRQKLIADMAEALRNIMRHVEPTADGAAAYDQSHAALAKAGLL